jgi:hypothetical protein
MGLGFTPADKGEWKHGTTGLYECSFLKRSFAFHPKIGQIVAPLEKLSMQSTLNYVSDAFRNDELTTTKLTNFQRECYLHYFDYEKIMEHVKNFTDQKNIIVDWLPEDYLIKLYRNQEYGDFLDPT